MKDIRIKKMLDLVPNGATVLNIGCAQNPHIHRELAKKSRKIIGIDTNQHELKKLAQKGFETYVMDAEKIKLDCRFDCIIAGELIEHLNNPGLFLQSIDKYLKKNGTAILTTPNISSLFLYAIVVIFNQTQDPTHVYYFDEKNLKTLIGRFNFRIKEIKYIPPDIKFHGKGILFRSLFFASTALANIGYLFNKRLFSSYLLIVIKRKNG